MGAIYTGELHMRTIIEAPTLGDSPKLVRLLIDEKLVAETMTASQVHVLAGDLLERIALPRAALTNA